MAADGGSQLFSPFRALGLVTNHVPLAVQAQGTENLIATAVGSSYHVYNVSMVEKDGQECFSKFHVVAIKSNQILKSRFVFIMFAFVCVFRLRN